MVRRFILIALLLMPLAAARADSSGTAADLQQSGNSQVGSSSLQPAGAGTQSLQQGSNSSSSPLQASNADGLNSSDGAAATLQQTDDRQAAKLLVSGEADQPHQLGGGPGIGWLGYTLIILVITTAVTAVVWFIDRRRQ